MTNYEKHPTSRLEAATRALERRQRELYKTRAAYAAAMREALKKST
jgi:hypothetical protein